MGLPAASRGSIAFSPGDPEGGERRRLMGGGAASSSLSSAGGSSGGLSDAPAHTLQK